MFRKWTDGIPTFPSLRLHFSLEEDIMQHPVAEEGKQTVSPGSIKYSRSLILELSTYGQKGHKASELRIFQSAGWLTTGYSCLSWQREKDPCLRIHSRQDADSRTPSQALLEMTESTEAAVTTASLCLWGQGIPFAWELSVQTEAERSYNYCWKCQVASKMLK